MTIISLQIIIVIATKKVPVRVCDDKIALEPVIECTLWYKWKYFSSAGSRMEAINNSNKLVSIHDQIFCVTSMDHIYIIDIT